MLSHPSIEFDDLIGTPITGSGVSAAITPGRWAAPPAPAIITFTPRMWAFFAKSSTRSGVRCADSALISNGIFISSRNLAASDMIFRSEVLPMMIDTFGCIR